MLGELGVIQQYIINIKTATFFEKSSGLTYLGLAAALAAWYNEYTIIKEIDRSGVEEAFYEIIIYNW